MAVLLRKGPDLGPGFFQLLNSACPFFPVPSALIAHDQQRILFRTANQPAAHWNPQVAVQNNPQRLMGSVDSAVQHRVVRQHRADARQDSRISAAQLMHVIPGRFSRNPFGGAGSSRDFSIQCHGKFQNDVRRLSGNVVEKHRIQGIAGLSHVVLHHFDSVLPKNPGSFARHLRIRISRSDNHLGDFLFDDNLRARRRLSVMAARLQRHVQSCARRIFSAGRQRISLRVKFAVFPMISLTDHSTVLHHHCAYQRVGSRPARPLLRQFNGSFHELFFCHSRSSFLKNHIKPRIPIDTRLSSPNQSNI